MEKRRQSVKNQAADDSTVKKTAFDNESFFPIENMAFTAVVVHDCSVKW